MAGLSVELTIDGEEAFKFIEIASAIIKNHKDDLTEQEKEQYQNAVERFSEKGISVE